MIARSLVAVLAMSNVGVWSAPAAAPAGFAQAPLAWERTDSRRFEIHYLPSLAGELERVTRSAERAYDHVSGRLNFVLPTRVPLVLFAPSQAITRDQVVAYAISDDVAPQQPHRSRIVLPLPEDGNQLDALVVHELTHLLVCEILLPRAPGDGGVPRWVHEGIASYMAGGWTEDDERLMRDLVVAGTVPALSKLNGDGGFANPRVNYTLGYAVFTFIEGRWGPTSIRRFVDALIVPNVGKPYDAVFELTPTEFDAAFRHYAERRFGSVTR